MRALPVQLTVQGKSLHSFASDAAAESMALREAWVAVNELIDAGQ